MSESPARRNATGKAAEIMPTPGSQGNPVGIRPKPVPQDAQQPPTMTGRPITDALLPDICAGMVEVLGGTSYAVMAGIALRLLGSKRPTADIDVFVSGSSLQATKKFVDSSSSHFGTHKFKGNTRIWYRGLDGQRYAVYIWDTTQIGHPYPRSSTGSVTIYGVRVLKPALLLNHKCKSWTQHVVRNDQVKMKRDGGDIVFLLKYMERNGLRTTNQEVCHTTPEFFGKFFILNRGSDLLFSKIGLFKPGEAGTAALTTVVGGSGKRSPAVRSKQAPS